MPMQRIFSGAGSGASSSTSLSVTSGRTPVAARLGLIERLGAEHLAQRLEAVQPGPQIDDAVADHRAETRPAAQCIGRQTHVKSPLFCLGQILSESRSSPRIASEDKLFGSCLRPMC